MKQDTRRITEGAMMCAIVGVLLFVNRQLANAIELFMYWVLTFPILIYTARYGLKYGILVSVCMLLLGFMLAAPTTIFYLFICLVTGVVYGVGVKQHWKNGYLLLLTGILTFLSYLLTTIVFAAFFGYDPNEDVLLVKNLLSLFHISQEAVVLDHLVMSVAVISAACLSILQTICIHLLSMLLLKRLSIPTNPMKSLVQMRLSRFCGYMILGIWILFFLGNVLKLNQELQSLLFAISLCAALLAIGYGVFLCMLWAAQHRKHFILLIILASILIPFAQLLPLGIGMYGMLSNKK